METNGQPTAPLAEEFHVATRNQAGLKHMLSGFDVHLDPGIMKLQMEAPLRLQGPSVALKYVEGLASLTLEAAITTRRSHRRFGDDSMTLTEVSTLLMLANAVSSTQGSHHQRHVPSSGNLGAIEVYALMLNVTGVEAAVYHFDSIDHRLVRVPGVISRQWMRDKVFFQVEFSEAAVVFVLTGALARLRHKYGERSYRLAFLDAGHVSQNIYLTATALDLAVCATAGFVDDEVDQALGIDGVDTASLLTIGVAPHGK